MHTPLLLISHVFTFQNLAFQYCLFKTHTDDIWFHGLGTLRENVWITKESHMHDIKLYSSYSSPHNYYYEKRLTRHNEWLNDWLTNLANQIQWSKLNQTKPKQLVQWNGLTWEADISSASLKISLVKNTNSLSSVLYLPQHPILKRHVCCCLNVWDKDSQLHKTTDIIVVLCKYIFTFMFLNKLLS